MLKINYSINGVKRWIAPDMAFWDKYWKVAAGVLIAFVIVLFMTACSTGSDEVVAPVPVATFSCSIEGTVDASPIEDRVKALAIEAASKGIAITGDYPTDVRNQSGEMTLLGTGFKFVFDANGQIEKDKSKLNLFLTDYPVEGGMNLDGSLGMAVDVGGAKVGIKGRVEGGKFVQGEVRKGWLPHIYGVLNGTTNCKV